MSDRLSEIKTSISHHLIRIEDVVWLIFEVERLRLDRSCCIGELEHLITKIEDCAMHSVGEVSTFQWMAEEGRAQVAELTLKT